MKDIPTRSQGHQHTGRMPSHHRQLNLRGGMLRPKCIGCIKAIHLKNTGECKRIEFHVQRWRPHRRHKTLKLERDEEMHKGLSRSHPMAGTKPPQLVRLKT